MTGGDICNEAAIVSLDRCSHHAKCASFLDELRSRGKYAGFLIAKNYSTQADSEREASSARVHFAAPECQNGRAYIGKPKHGSGVNYAERIQDPRPHRHGSNHTVSRLLDNGEFDVSSHFHSVFAIRF